MKIKYHLLTSSDRINEIPVETGNLIFDEPSRIIYLDGLDGRSEYHDIMILTDDNARIALNTPIDGFYFVESTAVLWRCKNREWSALTQPPKDQIVFLDGYSLPPVGRENTLYVTVSAIYRYVDGRYVNLGSGSSSEWIRI